MVRCISPAGALSYAGQCAADEIVYHCDTLCGKTHTRIGKHDVVVDQCRAVADLYEDILRHHATLQWLRKSRALVVMQQILRYACALCLPVAPDAHRAVVDVVAAHRHVDRCMHLDTCDLCSPLLHHIVDVVDMVVLNDTEYTTHTADDTALLTVMDVISADDMAADLLLQPSMILAAAYGIALHLGRALDLLISKVVVVVRVEVFADGDTGTFTVRNVTVLNDPALTPVRADHTVLKSGRRRPGRRCFIDIESADGDVAHTDLRREEALAAYVDLHVLLVRILALEICIDNSLVCLRVLLGIPFVYRLFRYPAALVDLTGDTICQRGCLINRTVI